MEDHWVCIPHRIIFGDTDAMGIVYYASYLRFFEMGRNEFLRAHGGTAHDLDDDGILMPVIEVGARYLAPARYDDEITIATRLAKLERVRVRFAYRLSRGDEPLTEGFTVHACVKHETGRPVRLPAALRARLAAAGP